MRRLFAICALAFCWTSAANATVYLFEGEGRVNRISALLNSQSAPAPTGAIAIGDVFRFSFTFDTDDAQLTSTFDADPTVNIYYLAMQSFSASIGSYQYQYDASYRGNSSLQMWNDRDVVGTTDSQSFSFSGRGPNALPFDTGAGRTLEGLSIYAFDFTASARNDDLLPYLAPVSSFASTPFSWLQYNPDANYSVHVGGDYTGTITNLSAAVPETATWAMLICGFGMIGGALRHRHSPRSAVAAA